MRFNPDIITGIIDGKKFKTNIITEDNNQYIIVENRKYYLNQFIIKNQENNKI